MPNINITPKTVTQFVAGVGASSIVKTIIKNNVQPNTTFSKVSVGLGTFALGGMASAIASKYTGAKWDECQAILVEIKTEIDKNTKK